MATPLNHLQPSAFRVVKQGSTHQDSILRDGQTKDVYVVVKNSPFQVQLATNAEDHAHMGPSTYPPVDLNHLELSAELVYDAPGHKTVDFVKVKPLETKFHVNESGTQASVECRLKVLTSQLEDMLFLIRFFAVDPLTEKELSARYSTFSGSIKVISKPEPHRKRKTTGTKKRTVNDMLLESLARVEKAQGQQEELLSMLSESLAVSGDIGRPMQNLAPSTPSLASILQSTASHPAHQPNARGGMSSSESIEQPQKKAKMADDERPLDFEIAFKDLMDAFDALAPDQRVERMRLFVEHAGTSNELLSELHDLFSAEGLGRQLGRQVAVDMEERDAVHSVLDPGKLKCDCPDCPHKQELERIEDFYKEVFSLG
eukprot:TRINITY_DN2102_c0_g1_i1.p1 TRINITY_DN2102_c0_g1~~TRINITY_DN2102_c0_g1_i1.p1  ORF type:complete len:372 (-),score=124.28 TRINITY_DN2102_c0_g1_i1:299-1414(-)